ncbi:hypothetical protein PIB30_049465 [Stylosanthes scabra]|uniref:Uncharacterized protein n=1 Tax=Stylosanthes scabra TaxID=79078 RepID=A0ABU6XF55_9FABA|nr:hypothetical protein [Stylosanthes scabra]
MKRRLPNNIFSECLQIQMFYDGLTLQSRAQIDSSAGGSLHTKIVEEAQDLIELVANNQYLYSTPLERGTQRNQWNPKEECKVIQLRSGKKVEQQIEESAEDSSKEVATPPKEANPVVQNPAEKEAPK